MIGTITGISLLLLCREPRPPVCVSQGMDLFPTNEQLDICRREIELYRAETKRFVTCLEDVRSQAISELNEAISRWNAAKAAR